MIACCVVFAIQIKKWRRCIFNFMVAIQILGRSNIILLSPTDKSSPSFLKSRCGLMCLILHNSYRLWLVSEKQVLHNSTDYKTHISTSNRRLNFRRLYPFLFIDPHKLPVHFRIIGITKIKAMVTAPAPPLQTMLRAASLTAIAQPVSGSAFT